jgi:hypothetical protein
MPILGLAYFGTGSQIKHKSTFELFDLFASSSLIRLATKAPAFPLFAFSLFLADAAFGFSLSRRFRVTTTTAFAFATTTTTTTTTLALDERVFSNRLVA